MKRSSAWADNARETEWRIHRWRPGKDLKHELANRRGKFCGVTNPSMMNGGGRRSCRSTLPKERWVDGPLARSTTGHHGFDQNEPQKKRPLKRAGVKPSGAKSSTLDFWREGSQRLLYFCKRQVESWRTRRMPWFTLGPRETEVRDGPRTRCLDACLAYRVEAIHDPQKDTVVGCELARAASAVGARASSQPTLGDWIASDHPGHPLFGLERQR